MDLRGTLTPQMTSVRKGGVGYPMPFAEGTAEVNTRGRERAPVCLGNFAKTGLTA